MDISNIQSKEICKYRTCLNYFIAWGSVFLSPGRSNLLLRGVIGLTHHPLMFINFKANESDLTSRNSSKTTRERSNIHLTSL